MLKSMVKGFTKLKIWDNIVCEGCQYGKPHHLPFEEAMFKDKASLELVHSNVFGKVKQSSITGCG